MAHAVKFTAFLYKNGDDPYKVKKQVWQSVHQSAIFYRCETWFTADLRAAESVYMSSLKQFLGVRLWTCNDIAMIEAGVGNAKSYINGRQCKFLHRLLTRDNFTNSYFGRFINMAVDVRCPAE